MRQIALDTETTGIGSGHRIIEIGCIEILERRVGKRRFHTYLNPDRDIDPGAQAVHGISREFLEDKPRFRDVLGDFLDFVGEDELIIHNAEFDLGFLDFELSLIGHGQRMRERCPVIDTLKVAREMHPGQKNSLDALCKRYEVDASHRDLHGALVDAHLLAEVYLAMTAGQVALEFGFSDERSQHRAARRSMPTAAQVHVRRASDEERAAHAARLARIDKASKGNCLWLKLAQESDC